MASSESSTDGAGMSAAAPVESDDRKPPRRAQDPAQTRKLLLESALVLFGANGFHATSVQQIVAAVGLTKGAFYHHFASKAEVLWLIRLELLDSQAQIGQRVLQAYDTATDQLRELVRLSVLNVMHHQTHVAVTLQEGRHLGAEVWAEFDSRRHELWAEATQILQRGVELGEFRPQLDTSVAMLGIIGAISWVHRWYQPDGLPGQPERAPEEIADELATMAVEGVRKREP